MSNEFYGIGGGAVGGSSANSNTGATSAAACSSSRWLTEEVFKLIDMVQRDEAIYNPRHKYYFCRPYVENFWREVDLKLEKNPGASLAKWTNLRISFRREYTNYLEEKVPPCWSYFDRMFFLHPYLRKKHQQPKSLDSQVQDALVQISSLSNRLQRERVAAAAASAVANINANNCRGTLQSNRDGNSSHCFADNYLDYFEDDAPNNSELDDIIEDEQQRTRFQHMDTRSLNNDIKSECEETVDEYDEHQMDVRNAMTPPLHCGDEDLDDQDDAGVPNFAMDALPAAAALREKRIAAMRMQQHLNRQQIRTSFHEEMHQPIDNKRSRSVESIGSSAHSATASTSAAVSTQRLINSSTPAAHSTNVSFVRPTFAKPIDMVSTTTNGGSGPLSLSATCESEIALASTTTASSAAISSSMHPRHQHRSLEIANVPSTERNSHVLELCDCKSDPDAMFLMSLLPDIQKLNGRDRGKIKIAFQNILQDYLYPD